MDDFLSDEFFRHLKTTQGAEETGQKSDREIARNIRQGLTPKQLQVLEDGAQKKSALCPRRSGKSFTAMAYAFDTCLRRKGAKVVIITLTLKSAKNIYWDPMRQFCELHGIIARFFINEQRIRLANGSEIMLIGAESRAQIDKLRGGKYHLVIIDECKSYPPAVMKELIDDVVDPALLDYRGTLLMIGTPGNILDGEFFLATYPGAKDPKSGKPISRTFDDPEEYWRNNPHDRKYRWSRHTWTLKDNPYLDGDKKPGEPTAWEIALHKKDINGWDDDHPTWQREYLGRWVASDSTFVYAFAKLSHTEPHKVYWEPDFTNGHPFGLPNEGPWYFVMGMDLGFEDDFAVVVCAYSPYDNSLYQVWEYKDNHQDLDQVAAHVARAQDIVKGAVKDFPGFTGIVADTGGSGGKTLVETMRRRYGWNIQAAEKRDKFDFIELLNTDFYSGRMRVMRHSDLAVELQALQWDTGKASKEHLARTGKLKEHKSFPNHLCDALLYLWRFSYHYWSDDRPTLHEEHSDEWYQAYREEQMARMVQQREAVRDMDILDELQVGSWDPLESFYGNR